MTKQEIEQAIKNGESVWLVFEDRIYKLDRSKIIDINDCCVEYYNNYHRCNLYATTSDFYETEARAKHFISHCGVTRTETLPFLTWEEFKEERYFGFYSIYNEWIDVYVTNGLEPDKKIITIENATKEEFLANYDLTETNFYKAYDECVRLFKGEV